MHRFPFQRFTLSLVALALIAAGCAARDGDKMGSLTVALQAAPGLTLNGVSYDITGPAGFTRSGGFDVSQSATVSGIIGGLPAGTGFAIALTSATSDGAQCAGSATFSVTAQATTTVMVHLLCRQPPTTGSLLVNGTINVCPVVDGLSASPAEVLVGAPLALTALAHDADAMPGPLTYRWTASSGALSDAGAANRRRCGRGGKAVRPNWRPAASGKHGSLRRRHRRTRHP